jgi:SAM-dependent methyltransferase
MERQDRVKWVWSARDNKELEDRYDQWAKDYDADLDEEFGYVSPQMAVDLFTRYVHKRARILDAGAGTGLVGELLAKQGYRNLVAIDLSLGMLEKAREKDAYRELHRMVLGETLEFPTASFDAVISVGVLTLGHAPASSLDELIRVTKPGGYIVYTLRPDVYRDHGFKQKHDALEAEGKWMLAQVSEEFRTLPKGEPNTYHQVWIYQVTSP